MQMMRDLVSVLSWIFNLANLENPTVVTGVGR